jgi:hypothetical protein
MTDSKRKYIDTVGGKVEAANDTYGVEARYRATRGGKGIQNNSVRSDF